MCSIEHAFEKLGVEIEFEGQDIRVPADQELRVRRRHRRPVPKIDDGPWPLFPADLMSIMVAVATQAEGTVMIFEKMFESRLFFTDKLIDDGRAHHPLRPAPRDDHRGRRSSTAAPRAPTSAPAWRC